MKNLKHSITLFFLLTISLFSAAQHSTKYGFELREYLKTADATENIPLLVEGDGHQIKQITEQLGGVIRLQFESLFSLEIPAQFVDIFAENSAVQNYASPYQRRLNYSTSISLTTDVYRKRCCSRCY